MERRKFLATAGIAPLGMAFSKHLPNSMDYKDTPSKFFDPWLEINTTNLAWNVSQVRKRVNNRPIMAVIKCNAYGHGLIGTAKVLEKQNIQQFAVVKVQEALLLRDNGIKGTILNFGSFSQQEAEQIVQKNISQSVFSETVEIFAKAARKLNKRAKVHIKVDTGLGRVGVPYYYAMSFIEKVASMPEIAIEGIFTTLTEQLDFDKIQVERLVQICDEAKKRGISVGIRHAASSAAVSNFPGSFLDMVRPGNCLYGLEKLPNLELKPTMSLKTRVLYVKNMRPGETVAYHRREKIEKDTLMATLPLGYFDGYPQNGVNKAEVLIQGQRWPMVVYMSANHVTVNITGSKGIKIGDEVVLFGTQQSDEISIGDVAKWGDSSVYKVAIRMNTLLPRIYI
jgi:alanine racemase